MKGIGGKVYLCLAVIGRQKREKVELRIEMEGERNLWVSEGKKDEVSEKKTERWKKELMRLKRGKKIRKWKFGERRERCRDELVGVRRREERRKKKRSE